MVDTFGTGKISDEKLVDIVKENFDLRPAGIIKMLDLKSQFISRLQHMDISEGQILNFHGKEWIEWNN